MPPSRAARSITRISSSSGTASRLVGESTFQGFQVMNILKEMAPILMSSGTTFPMSSWSGR